MESRSKETRAAAHAIQLDIIYRSSGEFKKTLSNLLTGTLPIMSPEMISKVVAELAPQYPHFAHEMFLEILELKEQFNQMVKEKETSAELRQEIKKRLQAIDDSYARVEETYKQSQRSPRFANPEEEKEYLRLYTAARRILIAGSKEKPQAVKDFVLFQERFPHTFQAKFLLGSVMKDEKEEIRELAQEIILRMDEFTPHLFKVLQKMDLIIPFENAIHCQSAYRQLSFEDLKKPKQE